MSQTIHVSNQILPIHTVLLNILSLLEKRDRLVVQAPPGAGKTTVIPLALLNTSWCSGKIILVQPRRLAVFGAAKRMANMLNEAMGETVGYRTRFDSKVSARTKIEVLTEGIFLRQIQQDPELNNVCCVIFDEFHERAINIDLGLAFTLDAQRGLRDETNPLRIIVMSATLDGEGLSNWLQSARVESEGHCFPVATHYLPTPINLQLEQHIAQIIQKALQEEAGNALVFLPGFKEIRSIETLLENKLPSNTKIYPLHASLTPEQQEIAIAPTTGDERKVVLATNVAETSVTIEGIRIVIDSGLVRISRFNERRGMDSLETERASQASADQRRGRAGRVAPGSCYRLWSEADRLRAFTDPEIIRADLVPVALELAVWGIADPEKINLPTPPAKESFARARLLLQTLDAFDEKGKINITGKKLARLGLHPRLGLLILTASNAAGIACAAILSEGDPLRFNRNEMQSDLQLRMELFGEKNTPTELNRGTWQRIQQLCRQLAQRAETLWNAKEIDTQNFAELLAHAFPDRIAQRRPESKTRYLLANGRGVQLNRFDTLAGEDYLIILDTDGATTEPTIRLAATITINEIKSALGSHIAQENSINWNEQRNAVEASKQEILGAICLSKTALSQPWPEQALTCFINAIRTSGLQVLPWTERSLQLHARINWLQKQIPNFPDLSDTNLLNTLEAWVSPFLIGIYSVEKLQTIDLTQALLSTLAWEQQQKLLTEAPEGWILQTGEQRMLDYRPENGPILRCKMQELYGLAQHPSLPNGTKLLIELISPAGRPIQLTRDLPGFWKGSYTEVVKEMRGRYPKHFWPENPLAATATNKTKKHM